MLASVNQRASRFYSTFHDAPHLQAFLMKLNPSGDDAGDFQQIINEMRQLPHLTLDNDFGFLLDWVLGVLETKDMKGVEDC